MFAMKFQHKNLTWGTCNAIRISSKVRKTITNSSMISCRAICILSTITRVYTFFVSTSQSRRTVWICETFWFSTSVVGVSYMSWQAGTFRSMISYITFSIDSASFEGTWILTFSVDTCLI